MSKIYFASDLHLGIPNREKSLVREKLFVQWLNEIKSDAEAIYLLGDIFDFWFEYKKAVPKGYVRLLGKLAEISDSGIPIHIFTGNHDMWLFDYLKDEINAHIETSGTDISVLNIKNDNLLSEYNTKLDVLNLHQVKVFFLQNYVINS